MDKDIQSKMIVGTTSTSAEGGNELRQKSKREKAEHTIEPVLDDDLDSEDESDIEKGVSVDEMDVFRDQEPSDFLKATIMTSTRTDDINRVQFVRRKSDGEPIVPASKPFTDAQLPPRPKMRKAPKSSSASSSSKADSNKPSASS